MPIYIKTPPDIEKMRKAGAIARLAMEHVERMIKPGVTELDINKAAHEFIRSKGGTPSFLGYRNFPRSVCVSTNDEVIHGVPTGRRLLSGDIVSVDLGVCINGFHGDMARTFPVGAVSEAAQRLIDVTRQSFFEGAKYAKQGLRLHEISCAVEDFVVKNGFNVLKDYYGHGIGKKLHEKPDIPLHRVKTKGARLVSGMTLAVEPMVSSESGNAYTLGDGFTVVTVENCLGAHYENTILVTDGEPEFLTL